MKFNQAVGSEPKLAEGQYDALLMGIVDLSLQPGNPNSQFPSGMKPSNKLKLIFEIPEQSNDNGTVMQGINLTASTHEKANLTKYVSALSGKAMKGSDVSKALVDGSLLGKPLVLTIAHWENDKGYKNIKIADINPLHHKIEPPAATRATFFFDSDNPDMKLFEELTYYTKKQIMGSLKASKFSKEMHASWAKAEEERAIKDGDRKKVATKEDDSEDLEAIQ